MRAMQANGPHHPLEQVYLPIPIPKDDEILIRVAYCGVCRTDLHIVDGDITPPHFPIIPGHQIVGYVEAKGSKANLFQAGDRVGVPWLGGCCFHCFFCLHEQENLCDHPTFTGFNRNGGFAEYCTAKENFAYLLPGNYTDEKAAPLLCAGLIGYRSLRLCGDSQKVGLLGFGASAHIIAQVCVQEGREVFAFTKQGDDEKQRFALELGAVWSGSVESPPRELLDSVIIFASDGGLISKALKLIRKGGSVVCAGIHMSEIQAFPYADLWNEKVIRSVANLTRLDAREFLEHAARHAIDVETNVYPLEEANLALSELKNGKFKGSAVLRCF